MAQETRDGLLKLPSAERVQSLLGKSQETYTGWVQHQVTNHPVVKVHHPTWKELIAWENGDQFSEWDEKEQAMKPVNLTVRKKRVVVNLMKPLNEAVDSKINLAYQLSGLPNSGEMEDIAASKIATKLLAHNDYQNDVDKKFEDMKYELTRTGNAVMKWIWDTGAKGYIAKDDEGGKKKAVEVDGDVRLFVPSIFNVRPDPTANCREDMRWMVEIYEVTEEWLRESYDITDDDWGLIAAEGDEKYKGMYVKRDEKDSDEPTFILKEHWLRASKAHPKGLYVQTVGNRVLFIGDSPALGEIPYWMFGYKRYGNSLWHTGCLIHIRDIQREFNRMVSIISEHIEGWRPKLVMETDTLAIEGSYTTDAFEILEINPGKEKPTPVNTPELSSQVMSQRDFMAGAVDRVSNVHEVSYSQLPQYATRAPASLYSMMLEQENIKLDPLLKNINKNIIEMGRYRLRLMDKFYKQPRLVKIVGRGEEASIEYFKGADLRNNFDVKLSIGVSLHQSKPVQQRLLLELKSQGIIEDNNKILKLLNMGTLEEELRGDISDEQRAMRENQQFVSDTYEGDREKGGVFVYIHDNHEVHLDFHTNLAKSEEAQRWPKKKWDDFQAHIDEHFQAVNLLKSGQPVQPQQTGTATPPSVEEALNQLGVTPGGGPAEGGVAPEVAMQQQAAGPQM